MADYNGSNNKKRCREGSDDEYLFDDDETKRLRVDLLFEILNEDEDAGSRDPAVEEIAAVMNSLEEEISGIGPEEQQPAANSDCSRCQMLDDLGYLLEASDDELGLPPPETSACCTSAEDQTSGVEVEDSMFGQSWGWEDEIYGGGLGSTVPQEEESVGGIFDHPESVHVLFDFQEFSWKLESLPAI